MEGVLHDRGAPGVLVGAEFGEAGVLEGLSGASGGDAAGAFGGGGDGVFGEVGARGEAPGAVDDDADADAEIVGEVGLGDLAVEDVEVFPSNVDNADVGVARAPASDDV